MFPQSQERHEMNFVGHNADRFEIWKCPICGRVIGLRYAMIGFDRVVIEAGDEYAIHVGARNVDATKIFFTPWADDPQDSGDPVEEQKAPPLVEIDPRHIQPFETWYEEFFGEDNEPLAKR